MLEPQPLHDVVQLDVDTQVVGVPLELVAGHQTAGLVDLERDRGHLAVHGQPPVAVPVGVGVEADERCRFDRVRASRPAGTGLGTTGLLLVNRGHLRNFFLSR